MTAKLNQILAVEKGTKPKCYDAITNLAKLAQKSDLFNGFEKQFQPVNEDAADAERLPPEAKKVQLTADNVLSQFTKTASEWYQITARKDWANTVARADIVLGGETILTQVPVTYILFLEKQITDLKTLVKSIPVLDEAEDWNTDPNSGLYKTEKVQTHRTKKIIKPLTMAPATDKHPAQVQLINEDVISGYWAGFKTSGAFPKPQKLALLERIEHFQNALKEARESANMTEEIVVPEIGAAVFGYIFKEFQ